MRSPSPASALDAAGLVDYDNFFPGVLGGAVEIRHQLNRMVGLVLDASNDYREIQVRLYGGWLEDGLLTRRGSELQAYVGGAYFPMKHPFRDGLLRGSISLVTQLVAVPQITWGHTLRTRRGLPPLRIADGPRPQGCAAPGSCPIDLVQRISRRFARECHVHGCSVINGDAFLIREQKMVDSMMCCDALALVDAGYDIFVLSDDLDVLPGLAMAAVRSGQRVVLVRSSGDVEGLYDDRLSDLGVTGQLWMAA